MSKLLLPWKKKLIFKDGDFVYLAFIHLTFLIFAISKNHFDISFVKILLTGTLIIIDINTRHWI